MPTGRIARLSSRRVRSRSDGSRFESGSSSSRTRGYGASARASATRCCWPPEISVTRRASKPESPASASSRRRAARTSTLLLRRVARAEGDVLPHRHVREERVVLEDHPEAPALGRQSRDVLAIDDDAARVGRLEAGRQAQHRRLAAARGTQQRQDLARARRERDARAASEGAEALLERFEAQESDIAGNAIVNPTPSLRGAAPLPRTVWSHLDIHAAPSRSTSPSRSRPEPSRGRPPAPSPAAPRRGRSAPAAGRSSRPRGVCMGFSPRKSMKRFAASACGCRATTPTASSITGVPLFGKTYCSGEPRSRSSSVSGRSQIVTRPSWRTIFS